MDNKKLVEELIANGQYDLADIIDGLTPIDAANYIAANKAYFNKIYRTDDLEQMPLFRKALYDELNTGEVDYDKEFGKDWYKDFGSIPADQIKFVADKQGVSYKDLVHKMGEEATKRQRHDIVHDGTVSGFITRLAAPHSSEAIERGESPSVQDAVLDAGQNILYAMPWASSTAPILARLGTAGKVIQGAVGNAATPAIMETADYLTYDDPDNPRSNWDIGDVSTETMVNASTPWILRGLLKGAGRFTTGKGADLVNKWEQFGTQRPVREDMGQQLTNDLASEFKKSGAEEVTQNLGKSASLKRKAASAVYNEAEQNKRNTILTKLDTYYNSKIPGYTLDFTEDELAFIAKDPILSKYLDIDNGFKHMPSLNQLKWEEEVKNYLTNEFGGQWYEEPSQSPWTRIPMAGPMIDKHLQEQEKERTKQAVKDSILYELMRKNLLHK